MTALADIIDDLKHLPSQDLEDPARYIHELRTASGRCRHQSIIGTAGSLAGPVGEAFATAVDECERINENA
jgi:hypothetical protein